MATKLLAIAVGIFFAAASSANAASIMGENGDWQVALLGHQGDDQVACTLKYAPANAAKQLDFVYSVKHFEIFLTKHSWKIPSGTTTSITFSSKVDAGKPTRAIQAGENTLKLDLGDGGKATGDEGLILLQLYLQLPGLTAKFAGNEADWPIPMEQAIPLIDTLMDCVRQAKAFDAKKEDSATSQPFAAAKPDTSLSAEPKTEPQTGAVATQNQQNSQHLNPPGQKSSADGSSSKGDYASMLETLHGFDPDGLSEYFYGESRAMASPSYRCDGNLTQHEKTICGNVRLSIMEEIMALRFYQARDANKDAALKLAKSNRQRVLECGANVDCLSNTLEDTTKKYMALLNIPFYQNGSE